MSKKEAPLQDGLLQAMRALDRQIKREVFTRDEKGREEHGQGARGAQLKRVEIVSGLVLDAFADREVGFDGVLVLTEAMVQTLQIIAGELGSEGLGRTRSAYMLDAVSRIERHARLIREQLEDGIADSLM